MQTRGWAKERVSKHQSSNSSSIWGSKKPSLGSGLAQVCGQQQGWNWISKHPKPHLKPINRVLILEWEVKDRDVRDNDDDDTCTSDDDEEDEQMEYDIPYEVYDSLYNYSKRKLIKVLLYYIGGQEGCISKIEDLKKKNFELSQENIELWKSNDLMSNDFKNFQEKVVLLEKQKDELKVKCAGL